MQITSMSQSRETLVAEFIFGGNMFTQTYCSVGVKTIPCLCDKLGIRWVAGIR